MGDDSRYREAGDRLATLRETGERQKKRVGDGRPLFLTNKNYFKSGSDVPCHFFHQPDMRWQWKFPIPNLSLSHRGISLAVERRSIVDVESWVHHCIMNIWWIKWSSSFAIRINSVNKCNKCTSFSLFSISCCSSERVNAWMFWFWCCWRSDVLTEYEWDTSELLSQNAPPLPLMIGGLTVKKGVRGR